MSIELLDLLAEIEDEIEQFERKLKQDARNLEIKKEAREYLMKKIDKNNIKRLGNTEAVRMLFDIKPDRDFRPKDVQSELESMIDSGQLKLTTGSKPSNFVRSALGSMKEKNEITSRTDPITNIVYYRKTSAL